MRRSLAILCILASSSNLSAEDAKGVAFFESRVRPVLMTHCYSCHSAEAATANKLKANLALDTREGMLKGGDSGPSLVPGKPEKSLLLKTLRHVADAPEMPPSEKLPAAVIADFEAWIAMGAPDPRTGKAASAKKGMSLEEGRRFWSLVPPRKPVVPAVKDGTWAAGDVDRFVQAAREGKGFSPVADADPRALVRRLSFDLIGLPPGPEMVEAFANDPSPRAYAAIVDELLASPHYGERWGRHWLDLARYADSNGRDRNILSYHAWRYRNYVIDSFNQDTPYHQFLREQIAGDLLPASNSQERDRLRIATGFLVLGPKAFEEQKPEIFRMDVIDEQIELLGRTVLGLSVGCARCHDHKFDPIPTQDYYALAGILRSTEPLYGQGTRGIKATAFHHTELQPVGPDAARLAPAGQAYLDSLQALTLKQNTARSDRYREIRRLSDAKVQIAKPGADKPKLQTEIDRLTAVIAQWDVTVKAAEKELQNAQESAPPMPGWAMAVRDRAKPEDCRIHIRGETTNLGEISPRGVLQVLPQPAKAMPTAASGRLELADWLTSPANPLTARVHVNRVWQHLFGRGLVTTPDDFGVNGAKPTHPELLDFLAIRFQELGFSHKKFLRELILSRTYRLASVAHPANLAVDPDNLWLWRMAPRRLEAEVFRDAVLSVSGRLDSHPPREEWLAKVHPYQFGEYFSFKPPFGQEFYDRDSRSVYLPIIRGVLPEMFQLFDFASPDRVVAKRDESTLPAQSLFLLNSAWVIAEARRTAERLLLETSMDDADRVKWLFRRAFSREPNSQETSRAKVYLGEPEETVVNPKAKLPLTSAQRHLERWTSFCQAIFASAEFRTLR